MTGQSGFQPEPAVVASLVSRLGGVPDLVIILGSGLGEARSCAEPLASIPYRDIPGFPHAAVSGHAGILHSARLHGWNVWFFCGRVHLYEGYTASTVVASVKLAAAAGAKRLLVTNAAGAIPPAWAPGSFMWIEDHLNFTGDNPLRGLQDNLFVDMTRAYCNELYPALYQSLLDEGITLHKGVLACLPGPSYETPAEIRALQRMGADAVSMSTVPEVIMARYLRLQVVGISLLVNAAAGVSAEPLDHQDVLNQGSQATARMELVVPALVQHWQNL